jgi:hypothetical protein
MFLFRAFDTFVVKVDGGHQPGKRRMLKHHTIYHVKQQPPGTHVASSFASTCSALDRNHLLM